jgi:hypothetical protein
VDIQQPFFREGGEGPGVVCVHSNASPSGQWRELIEILSPRFKVLASIASWVAWHKIPPSAFRAAGEKP